MFMVEEAVLCWGHEQTDPIAIGNYHERAFQPGGRDGSQL